MRPKCFLAAVLLVAGTAAGCSAASGGQPASVPMLCGTRSAGMAGGAYILQNNEYGSHAVQCVTPGRSGATFTVTKSAISMPGDGGPGGYPSLYQGCHWGSCSSGGGAPGLAANPVQVSDLRPGQVTTSWSTALPGSAGAATRSRTR